MPRPRGDSSMIGADASVAAVVLAHGSPGYFAAASETVRSLLEYTDFDVVVHKGDGGRLSVPVSRRVVVREIPELGAGAHRARRFLRKFAALGEWLQQTKASHLVLLDADTVVVAPTSAEDVRRALDGRGLGMVEQPTIRGSGMDRADFLRHYVTHSLAFIAPEARVPSLADFRFFNSGVVLGSRPALERATAWALEGIARAAGEHQVGEHMIADQDYLQVWANTIAPGSCASLPGEWNHCEHWHADYPAPNARIVHFSNFCRGPGEEAFLRMRAARRRWPPAPARPARESLVRRLVAPGFTRRAGTVPPGA